MNKKIVFLNILIILLMIFAFSFSYALDGTLNQGNINFRKQPDTTKDNVIGSFSKGEKVKIISKEGTWYKVQKEDGTTGYVSADFVDEIKNEEGEEKEKEVNENQKTENTEKSNKENTINKNEKIKLKKDIDIYSLPIYYAKKIKNIKEEDEVEKIDEIGIWIKIKTENGYIGWALKSDL